MLVGDGDSYEPASARRFPLLVSLLPLAVTIERLCNQVAAKTGPERKLADTRRKPLAKSGLAGSYWLDPGGTKYTRI